MKINKHLTNLIGVEKRFWVLFAILNFLLFLPVYLVNFDNSTFFPINSFTHGPWYEIIKAFFKRNNYDIFRLSIDLTIWVAVYYFFRNKFNLKLYCLIASGYYLILLIFLIYYHLMYKLFLVEPILYNDIYLLKLGYYNIDQRSLIIVFFLIIGLALLYYLVYVHLFKMLNQLRIVVFGKISKILIFTIAFLLLFNFCKSGITLDAEHVFQIASAKLIDNLQQSSQTAKNISHLNVNEINKKSAEYKTFSLKEKPDIYLLFFESYGRIVYQDSSFLRLYKTCNRDCEKILSDNGWYMTSNFSLSPISGGGSWISYTSVMFGFNFRNQSTYLYFLRNPEITKYTNIFRYFQSNGYKSYWINPIPENSKMVIPWKLYTDFYGIDQWISNKDINYHGQQYDFGPSPPDQYSIFKAEQIIDQDIKRPRVVFYITHNSHNPFFCPDSVVENWQTLSTIDNTPGPPSIFIKKPQKTDYIKSINYVLQTLTKFIVQTNNKNAIYIIVGDHQPPVLSTKKSGFETPIHIIGADSTFIESFARYGFSKGLFVGNDVRSIRHEAIYSMFLRELIGRYGTQTTKLPEYLSKGINTK
jgi:hypothetical protein